MIGKLKGIVETIGEDWVLIDVQGVCYEVHCAPRMLANLPAVGEAVQIAIETHVRETEIKLFGFADELERQWFRKLQSVQGVGAKVALAIIGTLTPSDLANAITLQDKAIVAQAPGVGPKVAGRIVSELKDKVPALSPLQAVGESETGAMDVISDAVPAAGSSAVQDAVSALTNLGYQPTQAANAIATSFQQLGEEAKAEELIRHGLKELAQ